MSFLVFSTFVYNCKWCFHISLWSSEWNKRSSFSENLWGNKHFKKISKKEILQTGSVKNDTPPICTKQDAWPIQVTFSQAFFFFRKKNVPASSQQQHLFFLLTWISSFGGFFNRNCCAASNGRTGNNFFTSTVPTKSKSISKSHPKQLKRVGNTIENSIASFSKFKQKRNEWKLGRQRPTFTRINRQNKKRKNSFSKFPKKKCNYFIHGLKKYPPLKCEIPPADSRVLMKAAAENKNKIK